MVSLQNKTLPRNRERNEESCGDNEREAAIVVPVGVRPVVVGVQPTAIVVPVRVEQVRITVGIARDIVYTTTPRILSGLYRIWHRNTLKSRAKYLRFLDSYIHHPIQSRDRGYSRCMDTGFGSGKP